MDSRIGSALHKLGDAFLRDIRGGGDADNGGWGQFIEQPTSTQIGLYGTCSGLISVSSAYGSQRVPAPVVHYLKDLWSQRNDAGSSGSRNFSLTARRAFLLLALRSSKHPGLLEMLSAAESELRDRLLDDGLFVSWQVDAGSRATIGDEFTTALCILAYSLTTTRDEIPPEIRHSAQALQKRFAGVMPANLGVMKFGLAAITSVIGEPELERNVRKALRTFRYRSLSQDTLNFWDYRFKGSSAMESRRDYLHVPSDALDILLGTFAGAQRLYGPIAMERINSVVDRVIERGIYDAGREISTSNNQAWISLSLVQFARATALPKEKEGMVAAFLKGPRSWFK